MTSARVPARGDLRNALVACVIVAGCTTGSGPSIDASTAPPAHSPGRPGPPAVSVPDLVGLSFVEAARELLDADLRYRPIQCDYTWHQCERAPVVKQDPDPGVLVPDGTLVELQLSFRQAFDRGAPKPILLRTLSSRSAHVRLPAASAKRVFELCRFRRV